MILQGKKNKVKERESVRMRQKHIFRSLIAFIVILLPAIILAENGPYWEEESVMDGHKQVLQNAFDEIVHRRRRSTHPQVVDVDFETKENKSINALSQAEKDYLLLVHNAYRSAVEPFAANMLEVVWDDDIAAFAQDWANQCKAEHRKNRNLKSWRNMGENIYWYYGGRYHEGFSTQFWWDEVQWYNFTTKECVPGKLCGHYVTMVWAVTSRIGCGVNRCARLWALPDHGRGAYYFVCNYSGRFYSNARPYTAHTTICSRCFQTDFPKCRYNLCVTKEMLDYDIGYNGSTAEIGFNRTKTLSSRKFPATPAPTSATTSRSTEFTSSPTETPTDPTEVSTQRSESTTQEQTATPTVVLETTDEQHTQTQTTPQKTTVSVGTTAHQTDPSPVSTGLPSTYFSSPTSAETSVSSDTQPPTPRRTTPSPSKTTPLPYITTPKDKPFVLLAVDEILNSGHVLSTLSAYCFISTIILILYVIYG